MRIQALALFFILSVISLSSIRAESSSNKKDSNPKKPKSSKAADEYCEDDETTVDKVVVARPARVAESSGSKISLGFAFVAILAAVTML